MTRRERLELSDAKLTELAARVERAKAIYAELCPDGVPFATLGDDDLPYLRAAGALTAEEIYSVLAPEDARPWATLSCAERDPYCRAIGRAFSRSQLLLG